MTCRRMQGAKVLVFNHRGYDFGPDMVPSERWTKLCSNIFVLTQQMADVEQLPRLTAVRRQGGLVRARAGKEGRQDVGHSQEASFHITALGASSTRECGPAPLSS